MSTTVLFPDVGQRGPGNKWELRQQWRAEGADWRLTLERGFAFAPSVPRLLWPLVSPMETFTASAPHDFVYRHEGQIPPSGAGGRLEIRDEETWVPFEGTMSRRNADRFFEDSARAGRGSVASVDGVQGGPLVRGGVVGIATAFS
jgi:hypothetical protein